MVLMTVLIVRCTVLAAFEEHIELGILFLNLTYQLVSITLGQIRYYSAQLRLVGRDDVEVLDELGVERLIFAAHVEHDLAVIGASVLGRQRIDLLRNLTLQHQNVSGGNSFLPSWIQV